MSSMHKKMRPLVSAALISILFFVNSALGQKVTVDADPAHVANTYSPVHSLGAAIDRLRTGSPDHLLKDPLLKEILNAGWQTVTYRQNTELMVGAWHRDSQFMGVPTAASRIQSRRWQRMVAPHRRRHPFLLEE